jgi:diguanylate cyclase (GGDEF)-like protein
MAGITLISVLRVLVGAAGLILVGRLVALSYVYLSWRAPLLFVLAAVSYLASVVLLFFPGTAVIISVTELFLGLGLFGVLLEHILADRLRLSDSQKLMEQRRKAVTLAEKRAQELQLLSQITRELTSSLDLRDVLQAVVDRAMTLGEADAVTVFVRNSETGELTDYHVSSARSQLLSELPAPRAEGLTAAVARSGEAAFINDVQTHPLYAENPYPELRSIACLPLRQEDEIIGVLNVSYLAPHIFDDDEAHLLNALADTAALAVRNAVLHERISRMAVTDELTNLANRRRFLQAVRSELQRARRYQKPVTMLMVDLDRLKQINDTYGHAAGDAMLRGVAHCLRACVRDTDVPARLGGDEFAVLLPETDRERAVMIAERIREAVEKFQTHVNGTEIASTVSIGVVSREAGDLPDLPTFVHLADDALYKSKTMGRNTVTALEPPPAPG